MTGKKFIFLAGHHRSGTSLLHRILSEHPEVSGFSGTGVPENEGQHLQSVYEPAKTYGGPGRYIFNDASYMNEDHPLATSQSARDIFKSWAKYYDSTRMFYIEKSPPNLIRTRFLQKLFPGCLFLVIFRHPIAVAYATQRMTGAGISSLIEHTLRGYELFLADLPHLNDVYILRYEDFVAYPQHEINRVCSFLALDSIEISYDVQPDVNKKYFSAWGVDMGGRLIADLLEYRANSIGYSLRDPEKLVTTSFYMTHQSQNA
ncbi:sulfotransferase [Synechococcus sp. CS-205]|uniref:sulfotransferase family protein n=1 Tax=Synechococcus sp. CS-205 TaxID=2847984 RepID=UPI00223C1945|nr:sulfotransferase [Synechococcus sp. CS-205]MCT0248672.1 sulfotransferase [Synechococcus sp. CS-205]